MENKFTHLHLHTEFSFLDGMTRVWDVAAKEAGELIHRLKEIGQDSCAITDHGSTAGWVRFEKACSKNGIKPILGVEGYYCNNRKLKGLSPEQKLVAERGCSTAKEKKEAHKRLESKLGLNRRSHFCSWAMNKKGCYEILATMSTAARDGFYNKPRWDWPLIKVMNNCLFSSACMGGILGWEAINVIEGKAPKSLWPEAKERAWEEARKWKGLLGDRFYIEMMAIDMRQQVKMNELMWAISKDLEIPMIITNDPHYARPEDWEAHDILLAINSTRFDKLGDALTSNNRLRYDAHDLYIKSYQEMYDSFTQRNPKIPEEVVRQALATTQEVAARCKPDALIKGKMIMPKLDIPENADHDEKEAQKLHLVKLCKDGWKRKVLPYVKTRAGLIEYRERLEEELGHITKQGFTPYFILCNKLMKWVDEEKLERGPARGSSCGSLVAYLLDITMIDPIPHKLLFSRFIDPNRTDYPDVDMDFEDRRRREVVQYFINNYGDNNVAILGNNMVFKPKMALKDVSRLYHVPLKEVQELCNLVIERSGADSRLSFCLEDTFGQHEFAKEFAQKYPLVKQYAAKLEGTIKNCVSGDTWVVTKKQRKKLDIESVYEKRLWAKGHGLYVKNFNGNFLTFSKVKEVFFNGMDKVYRVTAGDYSIKCTAKHRFLTPEGYKPLSSLKVGDRVGCNGVFLKGQVPWNKGTKGAQVAWNKGLTKETSESVKKQAAQMVGNVNGSFKKEQEYYFDGQAFRKKCIELYGDKCLSCGAGEEESIIIAHHINKKFPGCPEWYHSPRLNGTILCATCHAKHHKLGSYERVGINPRRQVVKWVELVGIEDAGEERTYDLAIDTEHEVERNYVANGFITHNSGVHAAGVIIADGDIRKYTSLRKDKKSDFPVSTIDKNDAEDIGLLKMDVLGLNTMTILNEAKRYIQQRHGLWIGLEDLVKDVTYTGGDPDVYQSFSDANTVGVFQFGSPGLTRLAKQVKIERFSEVSDCTALHRPGPIHSGAMAKYPALKFGKGKAEEAEHEVIARWTQDTYGLIIYQEQVMQIVRELGDFDWAQTNTVRKVMSKSGGAEYFMKTFWPQWKKGCNEKGMDDATAEKAFKRIMSFGSWAFNKSHSIAYAFVSYFCMWFKVHYPLEYCTAYLNTVSGDIDNKIKEMIKEVVRLGIELREPDINISKHKFVIDDKAIVAGLSNIKNVGEKAIQAIIDKQPFTDIMDFMERVDSRACNKRSVENLIKAGAFDRFGYDKKKLLENLELIHKNVKKKIAKGTSEARRLLAECMGEETFTGQEEAEMKSSVSPITVGKHLSEYYEDVEKAFGPHINLKRLNEIVQDEGEQQKDRAETKRVDVLIRGVLTSVDLKRLSQEVKDVIDETKEQRYALANLEDETDFIVLSFKNEIYTRYEQKLYPWRGKVLLIRGSVNIGWKKVFVDSVFEMDELRAYLNRGRMPLNFAYDYLFQHPLHRYFSKVGGIGTVRKKYGCRPLKYLARIRKGESMWAVGLITDIHTFTAKRGQSAGQDFYWVFFEDETFQGSFMVFPGDKRFKAMKMELFTLYENKSPFLLQVQRDMKFDPNKMEFKQVSISIDKRKEWTEMIKKPFKFKPKPATGGGL